MSLKQLEVDHKISRQIQLEDEEVKIIIAILRFSSNSCPIEHFPEHKIELETVKNLISKFEEALT
jgi:hypothetical protein